MQAAVGDGSRRADILLQGRGVRVVVEVDGPSHFVSAADGRAVREDGATVLRNWQLQRWGYTALSVPVADKSLAQLRSAEHAAWLVRQLRDRGVLVGWGRWGDSSHPDAIAAKAGLPCRSDRLRAGAPLRRQGGDDLDPPPGTEPL